MTIAEIETRDAAAPITAPKAAAPKAWPTRQEFAARLKDTRQANAIRIIPGFLTAIPSTKRIQPFFLGGDAGTGKGKLAETVAAALGWKLVSMRPSTFHKTIEAECRLNAAPESKVFFLDESAEGEGSCDADLLEMLNTSDYANPFRGGKEENAWEYNQGQHLFLMASNKGEPNPALVGPSGRMVPVAMLPFTGQDLAWFLDKTITECKAEFAVTFEKEALPLLLWLTSGIARNVQNVVRGFASAYAGGSITCDDIRALALELQDEKGRLLCAPAGREASMIAVLQYLAPIGGAVRENQLIGATMAQQSKVYRARIKPALLSQGLMSANVNGFAITRAGQALLKEIDDTLSPLPPAPMVKPGKVKPAMVKKGGTK